MGRKKRIRKVTRLEARFGPYDSRSEAEKYLDEAKKVLKNARIVKSGKIQYWIVGEP